jgi:hypothetical protein
LGAEAAAGDLRTVLFRVFFRCAMRTPRPPDGLKRCIIACALVLNQTGPDL